jgi:membrane-associated phospholipid phosphatase
MYATIFESVGDNGPYIMILASFVLLFSKPRMLFYFVIGVCLSFILNNILKGVIKQPRPEFNTKVVSIALQTNEMRYVLGYDIYGMPSGHAQTSFFITTFLYLVTRNLWIAFTFLLLSFIVMCQRVFYNEHTILQVLVGAILGILFGFFVYHIGIDSFC